MRRHRLYSFIVAQLGLPTDGEHINASIVPVLGGKGGQSIAQRMSLPWFSSIIPLKRPKYSKDPRLAQDSKCKHSYSSINRDCRR